MSSEAVVRARTLVTDDGVPIEAAHLPGDKHLAFVVAHGFTLSWQRPMVWQVARRLNRLGGVVIFDFRGHGRSGGLSTLGDREIHDLDVAVAYARELGYRHVAAVGFSMGASVVVRYAGLIGGIDAAVSVSGPGRWYYRGTTRMRRVHWAVERRLGRFITRNWLNTRVSPVRWDPVPVPPHEAAARISPIPFLVVHGDRDSYFPVDHAQQLYEAARDPKELWVVPGFGHAESATDTRLVDRIGAWVQRAVQPPVPAARPPVAAPGTPVPADAAADAAEMAAMAGPDGQAPGPDGQAAGPGKVAEAPGPDGQVPGPGGPDGRAGGPGGRAGQASGPDGQAGVNAGKDAGSAARGG